MAQVSFTNQGSLLGNYSDSSEVGVDMNGDYLDDFVRVSGNGVGIDYQQEDGSFESVFIAMMKNTPSLRTSCVMAAPGTPS